MIEKQTLMIAPHSKRFTNFLVDSIAVYLLTLGLGELGLILNDSFGFDAFVIGIPRPDNLKFSLVNLLVGIVYYGMSESLGQRTAGKYITNTRVVLRDGAKPDSGTILLRTLCRQIPFEALSFLGPFAMGWHDSLSKTVVVLNNPPDIDVPPTNGSDLDV